MRIQVNSLMQMDIKYPIIVQVAFVILCDTNSVQTRSSYTDARWH